MKLHLSANSIVGCARLRRYGHTTTVLGVERSSQRVLEQKVGHKLCMRVATMEIYTASGYELQQLLYIFLVWILWMNLANRNLKVIDFLQTSGKNASNPTVSSCFYLPRSNVGLCRM